MRQICEYCNGTFCSKSALNRHILTAKKCLELRNAKNSEINFNCEYCGFTTNRKSSHEYHTRNCKEYIKAKEIEFNTLKNELDYLKKELEYTKQLLYKQMESRQ